MSQLGLAFDEKVCINCCGCQTACKAVRGLPVGTNYCRVTYKWRGQDLDARLVYFAIFCQQCVDAPCVAACPPKALSKAADGMVVLDEAKCINCRVCLSACPYKVPQFLEGRKMSKCDLCKGVVDLASEDLPCVLTCPTKALELKEMSAEAKKAQEARYQNFMNMPKYVA